MYSSYVRIKRCEERNQKHVKSVFQNTAAVWRGIHGTSEKCQSCRVWHGGVGGYVCEALVRSGVGSFDLIDDKVCLTNLNRQIIATPKNRWKI